MFASLSAGAAAIPVSAIVPIPVSAATVVSVAASSFFVQANMTIVAPSTNPSPARFERIFLILTP